MCPSELIEELFGMQCKPEDGALSHGLGDKGGNGLPKFNGSLRAGTSRYRIVLVNQAPGRMHGPEADGATRLPLGDTFLYTSHGAHILHFAICVFVGGFRGGRGMYDPFAPNTMG